MPPAPEQISDPTDWLSLPSLSSLAPLESSLRCEICKDFYTAPVITQCSHTFCSGCIRRTSSSVNASRKCPVCWQNFDEGQLRRNQVVEEMVRCFVAARGDILALGRRVDLEGLSGDGADGKGGRKRKRGAELGESQESQDPSPRKTRSQRLQGSQRQQETRRIADSVEPEEDSQEEEEPEPEAEQEPNYGKVPCPICQQRMPEAWVYSHLDSCTGKPAITKPAIRLQNKPQPATPTMNPLPTLSYQLLKEAALRKKLQELGIPPDGNKATMSRRHTEWRNLVNANCDSSHPKSKAELLRELNQWERTLRTSESTNARTAPKANVMDKEFERQDWSAAHDSSFQDLIAQAKARAKAKAAAKTEEPKVDRQFVDRVVPGSLSTNAEPKDSMDISPGSQANMINLISPEKIQKVNGFDVP